MLHLVLTTLVGARLTNLSADAAYGLSLLTAASHKRGGRSAYLGAVHIKSNAARHRLHVIFVETRGRTSVTGVRAGIASIDAALKVSLVHLVHDVLRKNFPHDGSASRGDVR